MAVEREVKPREYQIRLARKKRRYHRDSDFRNRILAINRESKRRRREGEVKNPIIARKWRLTRLEHQIEDTAAMLRNHHADLVPLFLAGESKQTQVYLSPGGYLCLRPGVKAEFTIDTQSAMDLFGYKKVSESLKEVKKSLRLKK